MMKNKNKNKYQIIFPVIIFTALLVLGILTLTLPPRERSENENRVLAQMPEISPKAVEDGSFQKGLDDFLSDQIPLRDFWAGSGAAVKRLMGRKELGDTYLGKDGYYFQVFTDDSYSASRMASVFQLLEDFYQKHPVPTELLMVPSPGTILREKLPSNAPYYDETKVYDAAEALLSFPVLDLRESFLSHKEDCQLYYRTDHHWTTEGARLASEYFRAQHQLPPKEVPLTTVAGDFRGTLYSRVMDPFVREDTIQAPAELPDVTVTYDDGKTADTPYCPEFLEQKDKYAYFFGGNFGKVEIETGSDTGRTLLVFKDSFANSFVPFLFEDYSRIVMIDLRYYMDPLDQLFEDYDVSQVLYLYEVTNLLTDQGILQMAR